MDHAIGRFEASVGKPHEHAGIGLRAFGRFMEFRAGLDLRILVAPDKGDFFLVCVGNHDEIRTFINGG